MNAKVTAIVLLAILTAALILRLYGLAEESLWHDEGFSAAMAALPVTAMVRECVDDIHPPFYYLSLHYWTRLFGGSELALRLPSVIFGIASIGLAFLLGSLLFDRKTGVAVSLIMTVSIYHLWFSQEARMYALVLSLMAGSLCFFVKLLREQRPLFVAGYLVTTTILLYTHYAGYYIPLVQAIYALFHFVSSRKRERPAGLRPAVFPLISLCLALPWLLFVLRSSRRVDYGEAVRFSEAFTVMVMRPFQEFCGSHYLLILFPLLIINALLPFGQRRRPIPPPHQDHTLLLVLLCLVPATVSLALAKGDAMIFSGRNLFIVMVGVYLLAAKGIGNIPGRYSWIAVTALVVALSCLNLPRYYRYANKTQWRTIVKFLDEHVQAGDLVLLNPGFFKDTVIAYYSVRDDMLLRAFPERTRTSPVWLKEKLDYVRRSDLGELSSVTEGYKRVWVVQGQAHDRQHTLINALSDSFKSLYRKQYQKEYFTYPYHRVVACRVYLFERV